MPPPAVLAGGCGLRAAELRRTRFRQIGRGVTESGAETWLRGRTGS